MREAMERSAKVSKGKLFRRNAHNLHSMLWLSYHFLSFIWVLILLGGAEGSMFHTKRYAAGSGLNSVNLDFLPVRNVDDVADVAVGGVMAAVPVGKHTTSGSKTPLLWSLAVPFSISFLALTLSVCFLVAFCR